MHHVRYPVYKEVLKYKTASNTGIGQTVLNFIIFLSRTVKVKLELATVALPLRSKLRECSANWITFVRKVRVFSAANLIKINQGDTNKVLFAGGNTRWPTTTKVMKYSTFGSANRVWIVFSSSSPNNLYTCWKEDKVWQWYRVWGIKVICTDLLKLR